MNKYVLFALLLLAFLFGPSLLISRLALETSANSAPVQKPLNTEALWSLIQAWRQSDDCRPGGCQPYIKDQRLCEIAEDRIKDRFDNHEGLYEKYSKYPFKIQEIATEANSDKDALSRWLSSPPHAAGLRTSYKYSCIAVSPNYAIQIFSNFEK